MAIEWQGDGEPISANRKERPVAASLARGFFGACPSCGGRGLFRAFLKPVDNCHHCGEDMSHQRADDAPPYFTMLIVGHVIVPIMLTVAMTVELSNLTHLMIWLPLSLVMALGLLQPIKGAIIGLQWALYMHGFDGSSDPDRYAEGFLPRDPIS